MNNKLAIIEGVIILMVLGATVYGGYSWGHGNAEATRLKETGVQIAEAIKKVDAEYQGRMAEKDKAIASKDIQISRLRKDYQGIMARLRSKASEMDAIRPPVTDAETIKRLEGLGYKAK